MGKIKTHFQENWKLYLGIGVGVVLTSALVALARSGEGETTVDQSFSWKPRAEVNDVTINLVERSTPSKPVHLVGTNLYFASLNEAARETGHHLSQLSKHIKGDIPDLNGDVFELLHPAV